MDRIGNRDVIFRSSFIIPENEGASFDANVAGWTLHIELAFEQASGEHGVRVEPVGNGARIVFVNWNNSLGTATAKPANLGVHSSGRKLSFMASHFRIGTVNRLDVQLLLESAP